MQYQGGSSHFLAGCGMRDAGCGMRDAGCGMRDAGCGMRDAGCDFSKLEIAPASFDDDSELTETSSDHVKHRYVHVPNHCTHLYSFRLFLRLIDGRRSGRGG
jgi:hypothetical protein